MRINQAIPDDGFTASIDQPDGLAGSLLSLVEGLCLEFVDEFMEQTVPVDLSLEMHEDGPKADCRSIHEDEFAGRCHRTKPTQFSMHACGILAPIDAAVMFVDTTGLVVQQRAIDEMSPAIEHINDVVIQALEAPPLIGGDGEVTIIIEQRIIEIDDTLHEIAFKEADAAKIKQIDTTVGAHGIIAEVRIAMDDAIFIEWHIPGAKHVVGDTIA